MSDLLNIVLKLTGPVNPIGETNTDNERFENLKVLLGLMEELHILVDLVATENKDRHEFSMSRAGKLCDEYLDNLGVKPMNTPSAPEALSACPFCGGEAERDTWDASRDYVGCRPCDYWLTIERWNRRTRSQPVGEEDEVFWWWASGSVARHIPDREYQVVLKSDYDKLKASLSAAREGALEEILAMLRREHSVNDFGDVVGAQPEQGWETGYAAGIRCTYRQIKEQRALKPGGKS